MGVAFIITFFCSAFFVYHFLTQKSNPDTSKSLSNLIDASMVDVEFQNDLKIHEPEHYRITKSTEKIKKVLYASVYMGWLIAKGRYNESDYE